MLKATDLDSNRHLTMPLVPKIWAPIVRVWCHLAYLDKIPSTVSLYPSFFPPIYASSTFFSSPST